MSGIENLAAAIREIVAAEVARQLDARGAAVAADPRAELVTVRAFAESRSISSSTVRAAIRDGRLDVVRIGRAVRIRHDAPLGAADRAPGNRRQTRAEASARVARLARLAGGRP